MDQALAKRIGLGKELLESDIQVLPYGPYGISVVNGLRADFTTWDEYNEQLLTRRFSTAEVADGYRRVVVGIGGSGNA